MPTVTRRQFHDTHQAGVSSQSPVIRAQLDAAGVDGQALLDGADVDKDGAVVGAELDTLWTSIDALERFGWRRSVSSPRALAVVSALTPSTPPSTSTPTSTPTSLTLTPREMALQSLGAAAPSGVTSSEIEAARADIAARYGDETADRVLREGLSLTLSSLDESGVDWVQRHHGSMGGQIDRYQQVLRTHLQDARLIDANFDGKLDGGDQLWSKDASGRVTLRTLEPALLDRVKIGAAFVGAAEAMDKSDHSFALIKDHRFNDKYWTAEGDGTFKIASGARPSEALDDIFQDPSSYGFECATALVITQYKAMRDLLGAADFDRVVPRLRVGPWESEATLDSLIRRSGTSAEDASPARKASLHAGDYGYFNNHDVSDKGREEGWQGENVIYLGDGRFYGHPFGIVDEKTIVDHLNSQRRVGSTRSASFLDLRSEMSSRVLSLAGT